jgi:Protein of unknown function (DUF4239)
LLADALIIVACIVGALLFLLIVSRTYAAHARQQSNDFTGAVVAVIGTTYAVILAFMLSGVWNQYQQAQSNEEQEANALVNVWRIATLLPVPGAQEAQALCLKYADNAVNKEWPALVASKSLPPDNENIINELWKFAGQIQAHSGNDSIAAYQMMEELRMLTEYRRIREMQSREALPAILRAVLIVGGIITVASACFFGVPSFRFHVLQVAVLSFLISLVLVAIADIDRPYQGGLIVQPRGFSFARETVGAQLR